MSLNMVNQPQTVR